MKKFFSIIALLLFLFLFSITLILSTIGVETIRFNNLISKKINEINTNIKLELNSIRFKLDVKEVSLFLETKNPLINYRDIIIPAKNIKVYIDFISLIKSEPKIKKINLISDKLDINELRKISINFKPSNFNSFLNNKIKQGKLNTELEIYLDNDNLFENFIARGSVSNLKAEIIQDVNLNKTNFSFFADKSDVLLKNISSQVGPAEIIEGDLKIKLSSEISLESNFKTNLKYSNKSMKDVNLIKDFKYASNIQDLEAALNNSFTINFDKTYKVKKFDYKINGRIIKSTLNIKNIIKNFSFNEKINQLTLINYENNTIISGEYFFNDEKPLSFNLETTNADETLELKLDTEYNKLLKLELINYKKPKGSLAKIFLDLEKKKNNFIIKKFNLTENNNSILAENIKLNKDKFLSLKKFTVKTFKEGKKNNDFSLFFADKIRIAGSHFDATNLPKFLNKKTSNDKLSLLNKQIEIDFSNIMVPLSENLKNFKLIGKIEKGKFTKISSKGDFGDNNFLDISMKKDKMSQKKYLEIYSDLTRPLLTEYSFFKGLNGGKLLYTSVIDGDNYNSKLKIENFNVINAPGMVKLLSLADLSGLADLAEGEGLSFDILEINMEKTGNTLKLNEILALGPSISVLMEGYQNSNVTSLRGTLVPAKTLNKMISKIPVLGDIIIPKEVGEGLFGISFKMKGPPGKVKTTINPIRTVTPRFIQKIIDRNKKIK